MKNIRWWSCIGRLALLVVVTLTLSARASAEIEPPEVKALVGMKIPPAIAGKARGSIPNFILKEGESRFEEGMYADKWHVLIATSVDANLTTEILAVLVLPEKLRSWEYKNGEFKPRREGFPFTYQCHASEDDKRVIVGFYEQRVGENCVYARSDKVKRAWMFDVHKRAFIPIPAKRLWCEDAVDEECAE